MAGISVLIIALPIMVVSVTVSLWRFRRSSVKLVVLVVHAVLSILLMVRVGAELLPYSVPVLGPGLLIVFLRLGAEFADRVRGSHA